MLLQKILHWCDYDLPVSRLKEVFCFVYLGCQVGRATSIWMVQQHDSFVSILMKTIIFLSCSDDLKKKAHLYSLLIGRG
jgi:hypothetical protein